jgi:hypothetical protein
VILVIHPRKEEDNSELGLSSIGGTAKSSQESDLVMIIQKLGQKKYLQILKNRYNGQLGKIPLIFDERTTTFSSKEISYRPPLLLPTSSVKSTSLNDSASSGVKNPLAKKNGSSFNSSKPKRKTVHNVVDTHLDSQVDEDHHPSNNNHFDYYSEKSKEFIPDSPLPNMETSQEKLFQESSNNINQGFPETIKKTRSWNTGKAKTLSGKQGTGDEPSALKNPEAVSAEVITAPAEKKKYKKRRTVKELQHIIENI